MTPPRWGTLGEAPEGGVPRHSKPHFQTTLPPCTALVKQNHGLVLSNKA
jgi:hypothetical protein